MEVVRTKPIVYLVMDDENEYLRYSPDAWNYMHWASGDWTSVSESDYAELEAAYQRWLEKKE